MLTPAKITKIFLLIIFDWISEAMHLNVSKDKKTEASSKKP
ncbi:MAG: hypothetical protein UZ09_BCD002000423 [Bacteroidetes bacterium OLB9]|nr:MAG: hypothetical protein UZ09_BCD002000423 [Bacteroidetes bacterium OLB9]